MAEKRQENSKKKRTTIDNKTKDLSIKKEDVVLAMPTNKEKKKVKIASEETKILTELREKETIDTINITVNDDIEIEEKKPIVEEKKPEITRYYDTKVKEGLNEEIVAERKEQGLANIASGNKGKSILKIIVSNVFTFFNILYLIIAVILIIFKSTDNMIGFVPVVFANLVIGIIQEIKAKRTVEKMALMSAPTATVIRNGVKLEVPIHEVVLDDIIFFTPGKQICTDSIILEGTVEVNEALLTGEADSIVKTTKDELLSGSFIVSGVCVARVDRVGNDNYIEKVAADAKKYNPPKSELLRTLRGIIRIIAIIIFPIAILYLMSNGNFDQEEIKKVAYIILAMIPAGLFLLTTMALATGVIRLAKNKTLVQELYCIEMLARVDVLCLDKTGTITDGSMRVCDSVEVKNHTDYTIREIVGSMMNAFEDTNPTSEALIKFFDKNKVLTPIEIVPFSSKRKYSAVTFENEGTFILGAPEFILTAPEQYDKVRVKVDRFASQGCRVLILGQTNSRVKGDILPKTVRPIAIIVIQDHIRDDAETTIDFFKNNGVDIKVISGDNPETVSQIAQRVGIEGAERY
ncbi:MAG: HAD-IC family P-type ATPase, partial [Bacilli bacterium]|nr:HAD-IC family P-type ATPase [Bacilli bacterium]